MNTVNPFSKMSLEDVLDDLSSRFIINVPEEETSTIERICFQIEQAHWFYEDYVREQNPTLASFSLKNFAALLFHHCPVLQAWSGSESEEAFRRFIKYKVRVPVCGAIILNERLNKVLLVKGWTNRSSWAFPRGKINKDERELDCAVREVFEETGLDTGSKIKDSPNDYIELTLKEQKIRLYIVYGVPESFVFRPKTRKEISAIAWFPLASLPAFKSGARSNNASPAVANVVLNMESQGVLDTASDPVAKEQLQRKLFGSRSQQFYLVAPFAAHLKRWLKANQSRIRVESPQAESLPDYFGESSDKTEPLLFFGNLDHGQADTNQINNALMKLLQINQKAPSPIPAAETQPATASANLQELVSDATGASIQARRTNNEKYFSSLVGNAIHAKNINVQESSSGSMSTEKASLLYLVQHGPSKQETNSDASSQLLSILKTEPAPSVAVASQLSLPSPSKQPQNSSLLLSLLQEPSNEHSSKADATSNQLLNFEFDVHSLMKSFSKK